jgi:hypothetical protein
LWIWLSIGLLWSIFGRSFKVRAVSQKVVVVLETGQALARVFGWRDGIFDVFAVS